MEIVYYYYYYYYYLNPCTNQALWYNIFTTKYYFPTLLENWTYSTLLLALQAREGTIRKRLYFWCIRYKWNFTILIIKLKNALIYRSLNRSQNILISILEQGEMLMLNTWRSRNQSSRVLCEYRIQRIVNTWRLWNQSSRVQCEYRMQGIVNTWRLWNQSSRIQHSVFKPSITERFRLKLRFLRNKPECLPKDADWDFMVNTSQIRAHRQRERQRTNRRVRTFGKHSDNIWMQVFEYCYEFSRGLELMRIEYLDILHSNTPITSYKYVSLNFD